MLLRRVRGACDPPKPTTTNPAPQAKKLWEWCRAAPFKTAAPRKALRLLTLRMAEQHPHEPRGAVQRFRLPNATEATEIRTTWGNMTSFNFRRLKLHSEAVDQEIVDLRAQMGQGT